MVMDVGLGPRCKRVVTCPTFCFRVTLLPMHHLLATTNAIVEMCYRVELLISITLSFNLHTIFVGVPAWDAVIAELTAPDVTYPLNRWKLPLSIRSTINQLEPVNELLNLSWRGNWPIRELIESQM